jgi:hypothetical protein
MKRNTLLVGLTIAAVSIAAACSENTTNALAPEEGLALAGKGNGKGGGGGSSSPVAVDLTGGFEGALQQLIPQVENRKRLVLEGPGDCGLFGCKDYSFAFSDNIDANACSFSPSDLDDAARQDLRDHLDDAIQNRTFLADIDKTGGPRSRVGGVYFDDGNGGQYRIWIEDASVAEGPTDHFVFTGGTAWTVREGTGGIYCPFTGTQHLAVTR